MKKLYPIRRRALRAALFVLLLGVAGLTQVYAQPQGAINGIFTINDNGDRVYFSQGNLQYQASTDTWRFAENQYDYKGFDNENISETYDGWIDLFGWGTSGYNHGANCYQPWSTNTNYGDYYAYGNYSYNLYDQTGKADWGYNAISNGGNQENGEWRTLTQAEWYYLFNTRSTASGIRSARATVNGVSGVMIFPDKWNSSYYLPIISGGYESNQISVNQWKDLQQRGVVFLPAAGHRVGTSVNDAGSDGYYWSASCNNSLSAKGVDFNSGQISAYGYFRYWGLSVRLVRPAQNSFIGIEATPFPSLGGGVNGGGTYQEGTDCTLTATSNAGYEFAGWVENDEVVSTNPTYTFTVTSDRWLLAMFRSNDFHLENGTLNGTFSVSGTNKINFSQGNLQYIGSAATPYWKFAEHQLNFLGKNTNQDSENQNVDRDLFGWGTNGYNHGAVCYQPWSTSKTNSDYYVWGDYNYNLYDYDGLADWGHNPISNGGNQEDYGWRTMTNSEWSYIFSRNTASGVCFAMANVNGVNGVMLFPDLWNSSYYLPNYVNQSGAQYNTNILDADQWCILEQHGVVFLPAVGSRIGTSVSVGSGGLYWSASYYDSNSAYSVAFGDGTIYASAGRNRKFGQSVRLVRPAQNNNIGIKATPVPAAGGVVSGASTYPVDTECTLTATPSDGYVFVGWVENGVVVSTDLSCSFTVMGDRWLVAQFKKPASIEFADALVEAICLENWDDDHDGFFSFEEAAAVTSIDLVFKNNTEITSFDELHYFTGLESITAQAFSGCTNLASVTLPESITSIGQQGFLNCKALSELTIPNSVTSVGNQAFMNCTGLASVTIGSAVSQIGTFAFAGCSNIQAIHALALTPPSVTANAFSVETSGVALYVPCYAIATYQAHSVWGSFDIQNSPYELAVLSEDDAQGSVNIEKHATCDDMVCIVKANPNLHYGFSCWLKDGVVVSTERVYTFELEENTTLVARFEPNETISPHWVPLSNFENTMDGVGVVLIDGVEQQSYRLELGVFCGDECRGSVLPEQEGERWFYYFTMGGVEGDSFSFRLYDHTTDEELDLYCDEAIPFEVNGFIGDFEAPYEFMFSTSVPVVAYIDPVGAGMVTGAGNYPWGSSAELTATAQEGFTFRNWTMGGEIISTEPTLTLTVEGPTYVTAHFDVMQSWNLPEQWTWWSTYIELSDIEGLTLLEDGLGDAGIIIKNNGAYAKRKTDGTWFGSLKSINNETGYKIEVSAPCQPSLAGTVANPSNHPINIGNGWNWIGYPVKNNQEVNTALSGFVPEDKDVIKGQSGFAQYVASAGAWKPASFTLVPGNAYMYQSKADDAKTLVFHQSRSNATTTTEEARYWRCNYNAYPDNNSILAVVVIDGEEQHNAELEVGAFVDGVCRGSAPLAYDADLDRFYAVLTVTGEDGDEIHFGVIDKENGMVNMNSETSMTFVANAIIGEFAKPFEIRFNSNYMMPSDLMTYPNPVGKNQSFMLQLPGNEKAGEVMISTSTGMVVRQETMAEGDGSLIGLTDAGVYVVRVTCESGKVYYSKLIVR